jgi:hypothetical protein
VNAAELEGRLLSFVAELRVSGAPQEWLATFIPSRGIGPIATAEKFRTTGRVWRLGVLLLDADSRLYATGEVTRAIEPGRAAVNRSAEGERRRSLRMAASRSVPRGDVINFSYTQVDTSVDAVVAGSWPLTVVDGSVVVRLEAAASADLETYLIDRATLLEGGADEAFA